MDKTEKLMGYATLAIIGIVLAVSSGSLHATGRGGGNEQGQLQGQAQHQGQKQAQGQAQGQAQQATGIGIGKGGDSRSKAIGKGGEANQSQSSRNKNYNKSSSGAISGAASGSSSSVTVNVGSGDQPGIRGEGGRSSASGGSATAHGGEGGRGGQGGTASSTSGDSNSVSSTGDSTSSSESGGNVQNTVYKEEYAASSAASVYAGYCQNGGSGQTQDGGFSVINNDQFCDHIAAAEAMYQAYQRELKSCAELGEEGCNQERVEYYLSAYHENMEDAQMLIQTTQATGLINRIATQLSIPVALVAVLFIL